MFDKKVQSLPVALILLMAAEKKIIFEKEYAISETTVKEAEAELRELCLRSATFPKEIEKAIESDLKSTTDKLQMAFRFEKELTAKQNEGEIKLRDQIIETLKAKIKDLEASLKELSQKSITAETTVKNIAMKAIESSSKLQIIEKNRDNQGKD
jgi:hypothetical protein